MKFKIKFFYKVNKNGCIETLAHVFISPYYKLDGDTGSGVSEPSRILIGISKQNPVDVHKIGTGQLLALERAICELTDEQQKEIVSSYGQKFPKEDKVTIDIDELLFADDSILRLLLFLATREQPAGIIEIDRINNGVSGAAINCNSNSTGLNIYSTGRMFIHLADGTVHKPFNQEHLDTILLIED